MKKLVFVFPDAEARANFVGWFLDGGGDQEFWDYCSLQDVPPLGAKTLDPRADWDWITKGQDADEHVLDMQPFEDEET